MPTVSPSPTPTSTTTSRGPGFSGRVIGASGAGLAGICITAIEPPNDDRFRSRGPTTGSDGRYVVYVDYAAAGWSVEFWDCNTHPVYAPAFTRVDVPNGVKSGVNATLHAGASIVGVAQDGSGNPASGVCVSVYDGSHVRSAGSTVVSEYTVTAGSDGRFRLSGLSGKQQKLEFGTCKGSVWKDEWYKDHPNDADPPGNFENSDPIGVTLGSTTDIGTVTLEHVPT